ncbi:MAG: hypothetical protein A3I09_01335 [Deltaproteobacteria bacterium RIFCSPLOWO2_02_FULL_47_10]|nr:MAG: hypothetical protein A3I09_01335 [Deltaproteobacteria bacterium RIFCSPLOWO2_02_FULL_47_10]
MSTVLKISEACSIAIHAMLVLATNADKTLLARDIASILHVSESHLQKVLQRLVRSSLVSSVRGPNGGFYLNGKNGNIRLIDIYEAIEGRFISNDCLFERSVCGKKKCVFDKLLKKVNGVFYRYLSSTSLKQSVKRTGGGEPWKI